MNDHTMKIGNVQIVALSDMSVVFHMPLPEMWPQISEEDWEPFRERYPDMFEGDRTRLEIGCYLVRSEGRTILIDTGYGSGPLEHLGGLRGHLMAELSAADVAPEDIDIVILSHLHLDHVGWNTMDRDGGVVPTFPRARYIVHQADLDYFRRPDVQATAPFPYMGRYVEALVDLGLLDAVSVDRNCTSEVRLIHTPGHTPGHLSVVVASAGEVAIIQGDVFVHPAQVTMTEWNCHYDVEHEVATETRKRLLDRIEAQGAQVVSCHFPAPGFGEIVRFLGKRYWQAAPSGKKPEGDSQ